MEERRKAGLEKEVSWRCSHSILANLTVSSGAGLILQTLHQLTINRCRKLPDSK
jgi:hypothetical protein